MKLIAFFLFILSGLTSYDQCTGYPCDTLWYNEDGKLKDEFVFKEVRFMLGKPDLQTDSTWYGTDSLFIIRMYKNLDSLAKAIIKDGGIFEIQVHSDSRASDYCCSKPSQARAIAVCAYLHSQQVPMEKLVPKGYGETTPRIYNEGENRILLNENYINRFKEIDLRLYEFYHQLNRRVVVKRLL